MQPRSIDTFYADASSVKCASLAPCAVTTQKEQRPKSTKTAGDAAFEEDLVRQEEIFDLQKDDLFAKYPNQSIAVCGGDVFPDHDPNGAMSRARKAHPGRAIFIYLNNSMLHMM